MPVLLGTSMLLLGWAHYLIHIRHQGSRTSRTIVWILTCLVGGIWFLRFLI
ncbi:MAG: hypothetical protein HY709_00715 [Candidatus Latescibacteria bacterium]|nr:hypothetical protein [Candidatus Latescibacterota bacterium]